MESKINLAKLNNEYKNFKSPWDCEIPKGFSEPLKVFYDIGDGPLCTLFLNCKSMPKNFSAKIYGL